MINPEKSLKVVPARHFRRAKYGLDKFILIGRRKIHYVEAGNGAPILLIPGSSSTHRAWSRLIPLLSGDYRLLAFDFPIDPSSSEQVGDLKTVQIWSDLIATLIKQLNLEKVKLIGWGFGGAIAFDLAARFTDLVDRIVTISLYLPRPEKNSSSSRFDWKKWGIKRKSTPGLIEESENIRQPVLYLYGAGGFNQQSVADSLKLLQEVLPQIWIIALEGGIFQRLLKNPGEVVSLITKFLNTKLESSL